MDSIQGNQVKDFLDTVFKRKMIISLFFFTTVLTAVIGVLFFQPIKYSAYSKILIETSRGYFSDRSLPTDDPRRQVREPGLGQQIDVALEVLRDNELMTKVVNKIGPSVIYEDIGKQGLKHRLLVALGLRSPDTLPIATIAALWLQEELMVMRSGPESSIIEVAFQHKDPEIAANVVNSVVDFYVERHLALQKEPKLMKLFQVEFAAKKAELDDAERDFKEFKDTYDITSSPEDAIAFLQTQQQKNQAELDEVISQEAEVNDEVKQLRNQLSNTAKNPLAIRAFHENLIELQAKEAELSTLLQDEHPTMKELRAHIQHTQKKLEELGYTKRYGTRPLNESSSLYGDLQEQLLQSELKVSSLKARKEAIGVQLVEYDTRIKKLNSLVDEFQHHEKNLSAARKSYSLYQTKFEEFRVSDALDERGIANIKVLEAARIPLSPIPSKSTLTMLLSIFFGLFGGIGLALFIEVFSGTLKKPEDTESYLKRPVLATIPEFESGNGSPHGMKPRAA